MVDVKSITSMPKAELHAHLNGSLSSATLHKLVVGRGELDNNSILKKIKASSDNILNLDECFQLFKLIHKLTDNPTAITEAACDVIREFAQDNVHYLELRTTPRKVPGKMTMEQYLDAILQAIQQCRLEEVPILVKLIPSIDRSKGLALAEEIVDLTIQYWKKYPNDVVGLDVSGDMKNTNMTEFFPLLEKIRQSGLKLTIHTAEVHNDEETEAILRFKPDRIGHGTFIPPIRCNNQILFQLLKEFRIPIELCLTSNVKCKTVASYEDHHLALVLEENIPFTLCTDDKGAFQTSLSREYLIASQYFHLSLEQLWNISYQTLDYAFITENEKNYLQTIWTDWKSKYMNNQQ